MNKNPKNHRSQKYENPPITITEGFSYRGGSSIYQNHEFNFNPYSTRFCNRRLVFIASLRRHLRTSRIFILGFNQHFHNKTTRLFTLGYNQHFHNKTAGIQLQETQIPLKTFQLFETFFGQKLKGIPQAIGACTL